MTKKCENSKFKLLMAGCALFATAVQAQVTINIDAQQRGPRVSSMLYGIFYEDINHAADGGIYAELIRNRSFEDGPRYGAPADMQGWSTHSATPSQLTAKLIQPSKKTRLLNSVQHYVVRLAANDGMEENTLDTPTAIHPVEQLLSPENGCIPLDVPSYSLNIVRIK